MSADGMRASRDGGPLATAARELLDPFLERLPVTGASISVVADARRSTLAASDRTAARLEQLQFELGEGPHWQAVRSGRAVLVPDVTASGSGWPVFDAAASELEVGALFSIPMSLGAVVVGVVDLYRASPGILSAGDVLLARSLAVGLASEALQIAARVAAQEHPLDGALAPELRRVVHQATGMLLVQLDVTATEAFARLRAHAFATGAPLESIAQDVVARRLTLDEPPAGA